MKEAVVFSTIESTAAVRGLALETPKESPTSQGRPPFTVSSLTASPWITAVDFDS